MFLTSSDDGRDEERATIEDAQDELPQRRREVTPLGCVALRVNEMTTSRAMAGAVRFGWTSARPAAFEPHQRGDETVSAER